MAQKIKLTLETVPDTDSYLVRQVTNSVEWTPGEYIPRKTVQGIIINRTRVEVVINMRKNNG